MSFPNLSERNERMKAITIKRTKDGFSVRLRCGNGQHPRFTIALHDERQALTRASRMAEMARALVKAGRTDVAVLTLTRAGEQTNDADFESIAGAVRKLCAQRPGAKTAAPEATFRELAERWTSGKLAKEYPDHVRSKITSDVDHQRLSKLYPAIGAVPLREFSVAHAKQAMGAVPDGRRPGTRRHYAQLISRVLGLAAWPCELIERNPLPKGFIPRTGKRPAFDSLRPAEDARLLACTLVPFGARLLYGFLAREGCRLSEALGLRWRHLDLMHGTIRLERTKTGEVRVWALRADVARVLRAMREGRDLDEHVFARAGDKAAKRFRAYLRTAGVHRPELFERTEARRPIRIHDQRACFVSLNLAAGKSESWISDRTGHRSSQMINAYRRAARTAAELGLGELSALDQCMPELAPEARVCHEVFQVNSAGGSDELQPSGTPQRNIVGHEGLEPSTNGLRIHCSTN
jgi:integrase